MAWPGIRLGWIPHPTLLILPTLLAPPLTLISILARTVSAPQHGHESRRRPIVKLHYAHVAFGRVIGAMAH